MMLFASVFQSLPVSMRRLAVWFLVVACTAPWLSAQSLTPGVDANTVAFWPFDEPQYVNMPLIDAGPGEYDLRLRINGRMTAGKFGNSLEISNAPLPATMFAEVGGNLKMPDLTTRPVDAPTGILDALHGMQWTWECWVKLNGPLSSEAALVHLSSNGANTFYCGLGSGAAAVVMRDWVDNLHLRLPINTANLADGQWHHLALVKSTISNSVRSFNMYSDLTLPSREMQVCSTGWPGRQVGNLLVLHELYVDGKQQGGVQVTPEVDPGLTGGQPDYSPGLLGMLCSGGNLTNPNGAEVTQNLDYEFSLSRGSGWSEQWRGWIEGPTTGLVSFRAEAQWGVRVRVNGILIMDGWGASRPRTGSAMMTQGTKLPFVVEYEQRDTLNPHLKLYWSWAGHPEELVPPSVLSFTPQNAEEVRGLINASAGTVPREFEMRVGTTIAGLKPLGGRVDELRFSKIARYQADGTPPSSFSYNYGANAPAPAVASGPPLLFASDVAAPDPLPIAGNKHLFIDDALLGTSQSLTINMNPWLRREKVSPRLGGDSAVVERSGLVYIYQANGDMWNGGLDEARHAAVLLFVSSDGLNFTAPNLRLFEFNGTLNNSVVIKAPVQGQFFEDTNPNASPLARYKFMGLTMSYGQLLYYSPDGIHWTRNETTLAPFDCGGGVEGFWDDQRGEYFCYIRNEGWQVLKALDWAGKASALTRSREPMKPWPFTPVINPRVGIGLWTMPSMSFELPNIILTADRGHVFRARPLKYQWAPDAYFAFVWRGIGQNLDEFFVGDLGVSRDGLNWHYFDPWYMDHGATIGSETVEGVAPMMGLIRRGNELWNYAVVTTVPTNSQGGVYRFAQRLDGYVSLDGGAAAGTATTRTFTFSGSQLKLNVKATGTVRVGLVNANGTAIPGFGLANCTPVTGDSVEASVTWSGGSLAALAGTPVRMQLELTNAKLYAFQFVP